MDEPRISVAQCRELLGKDVRESLGDEEIERVRDMLYSLAGVITDAYLDLGSIDQSAFDPPGDAVDFYENQVTDLIERAKPEGVAE